MADISDYVDAFSETINEAAKREQRRIELALKGAIRCGYDGLDVNREPTVTHALGRESIESNPSGIVSLEPWHYPAPDGANGYRTERFTWDWFADETLAKLCRGDPDAVAILNGERGTREP